MSDDTSGTRTQLRHRIVIIGGGTAGITVAARLRRAGEDDVAIIEPSSHHDYQPLWSLVGGGRAPVEASRRREADVMPRGVKWIQDRAEEIDPEAQVVHTGGGIKVGYDFLVVAPGIQLDFDHVPGLAETLGRDGVSTNYTYEHAPKTWEFVRDLKGGTALFTAPAGAMKCGGAPQKIAYLAADYWRMKQRLGDIDVIMALPGDTLFGVPEFRTELERVVAKYGIDLRLQHELVELHPEAKDAVLIDRRDGREERVTIPYDLAHIVPPQSAPDWLKGSPLAIPDNAGGFIDVDQYTMQHTRYPNIFSLGDASGSPNAKTGAAVRKQAPVVVKNLRAVMAGRTPTARYDGYSSCPVVTARNRMLLAEFDYSGKPHPTIPLIDTTKERYDMYLLKRYGLPFVYWNGMLRGLM